MIHRLSNLFTSKIKLREDLIKVYIDIYRMIMVWIKCLVRSNFLQRDGARVHGWKSKGRKLRVTWEKNNIQNVLLGNVLGQISLGLIWKLDTSMMKQTL